MGDSSVSKWCLKMVTLVMGNWLHKLCQQSVLLGAWPESEKYISKEQLSRKGGKTEGDGEKVNPFLFGSLLISWTVLKVVYPLPCLQLRARLTFSHLLALLLYLNAKGIFLKTWPFPWVDWKRPAATASLRLRDRGVADCKKLDNDCKLPALELAASLRKPTLTQYKVKLRCGFGRLTEPTGKLVYFLKCVPSILLLISNKWIWEASSIFF